MPQPVNRVVIECRPGSKREFLESDLFIRQPFTKLKEYPLLEIFYTRIGSCCIGMDENKILVVIFAYLFRNCILSNLKRSICHEQDRIANKSRIIYKGDRRYNRYSELFCIRSHNGKIMRVDRSYYQIHIR